MRSPVFTGVCTALVTPFHKTGGIDFDAFGRLIDFQLHSGVDAVCVCGTTGEAATLTAAEHVSSVEFCVKRVAQRAKVIAGSGSNNTSAATDLSRRAQDAGADALLLVTPYYNKTSQAGLIKHYESISKHVSIPMILYNVPTRTGVSFTAETYRELSLNPGINGIKEASGDLHLFLQTLTMCGKDFFIWSGNDDLVVPMMALGAKGVISAAANIIPTAMVEMAHRCLNREFEAAAELQMQYAELIDALFMEVNPIPVKTAMNLLGMNMGSFRLPLCEMNDALITRLSTVLKKAELL